MIFIKCRRVTGSLSSLAPAGNSRSTHCRNSGVPASSSRLRQYLGPLAAVKEEASFIGGRQNRFPAIALPSRA